MTAGTRPARRPAAAAGDDDARPEGRAQRRTSSVAAKIRRNEGQAAVAERDDKAIQLGWRKCELMVPHTDRVVAAAGDNLGERLDRRAIALDQAAPENVGRGEVTAEQNDRSGAASSRLCRLAMAPTTAA